MDIKRNALTEIILFFLSRRPNISPQELWGPEQGQNWICQAVELLS